LYVCMYTYTLSLFLLVLQITQRFLLCQKQNGKVQLVKRSDSCRIWVCNRRLDFGFNWSFCFAGVIVFCLIHCRSMILFPHAHPPTSLHSNTETLDISDNHLTGTITNEFQMMEKLQNLLIDTNELEGSLEDILDCGSCNTTMQRFRSRSNPLNGSIPTRLFGFSQLSAFQVSRADLTGSIPTEFGLLTGLQSLDISLNPFFIQGTTIPTELGSLTRLEILYLAGSAISGTVPTELGTLRRLESLQLSGTYLEGTIPNEICNIETLETIAHPPDVVCECPRTTGLCTIFV
jgi:hypothetical protein